MVASSSRSVSSTDFTVVKYRSMRWAMMSDAGQATWNGGRVKVSSGFKMEKRG